MWLRAIENLKIEVVPRKIKEVGLSGLCQSEKETSIRFEELYFYEF